MDNTNSQQVNPRKLFVGNLPYSLTEQQLSEIFANYGEIAEVKLITDRMSGRSKGIAFVEFATEEAAASAMEATNGMEVEGRALIVNVARPFQPRERSGDRGGFGGGGFGGGRRGGNGGGGSRGGRFDRRGGRDN